MQSENIRGIDELAIALATPDHLGYNIVPVLHGNAGIGKSSTICSLFKGKRCEVLSASLYEPQDFGGFPVPASDMSCVRYLPPSWAMFDSEVESCLFLDDITGCHSSTQHALMRVVLEKRIGANQVIPPSVKIVTAANPIKILRGSGHPLTLPLCNRLLHVDFQMTSNGFISALENDGDFPSVTIPTFDPTLHSTLLGLWRLRYAHFLRRYPSMFMSTPSEDEDDVYASAFASPRSIEMALRLITTADILGHAPMARGAKSGNGSTLFLRLLQGSVGNTVAFAFAKHITDDESPSPKDVLTGKAKVNWGSWRDDRVFLFVNELTAELAKMESTKENELDLHLANLSLLDQITQLNACKKIDVCYGSIRSLAATGWLTRASALAHGIGETLSFASASKEAFADDSQMAQLVGKIETGEKQQRGRRGRVNA